MADHYLHFLQCPTCRKNIALPDSGKVEDFPTNFIVMNLIPDESLGEKTKKGHSPKEKTNPEYTCPDHKVHMEFYCTSCEKQVCTKCLLKEHKPDKHNIVTASDIAKNLSGRLNKLEKTLRVYKKDETFLEGKILHGIDQYELDKKRLEQEIGITLEREQKKLKNAAAHLLNVLNKKVEGQTATFANLRLQHSNLKDLFTLIYQNCTDLRLCLQQLQLSQSKTGIEKMSERIENLKDATESLKTACKSTPTKVGFNFTTVSTGQLGLGKLTKVSSKPMMILNSTYVTNKDCNVKICKPGNRTTVYRDGSCGDDIDNQNQLGSDLAVTQKEVCTDGQSVPAIEDDEGTERLANGRCLHQNTNEEQNPYNEFYEENQEHLGILQYQEGMQHRGGYNAELEGYAVQDFEGGLEEIRDDSCDDEDIEEDYADKYGHLDGNLPVV